MTIDVVYWMSSRLGWMDDGAIPHSGSDLSAILSPGRGHFTNRGDSFRSGVGGRPAFGVGCGVVLPHLEYLGVHSLIT